MLWEVETKDERVTLTLPPLALYVHVPWCVRKCPYCDFNSHQARDDLPEQAYLDALLSDLAFEAKQLADNHSLRPLSSIFFGGGTPSLVNPATIGRVITEAKRIVGFTEDIEITLEANPGTVDYEKFDGLYAAGVNRLSIGIQSFNPQHLEELGRIHSKDDALKAVERARQAEFRNINLDLMFGLPGQTCEQALADLRIATGLAPEHLSWYQLTIEPNTEFYRHPPKLPEDDTLWQMHQDGIAFLEQAGYAQYEVSAFARAQRQAKHNLNYWQFGDYVAIGAGAHGKSTHPNSGEILRYWKTRLPQHYLARVDNYRAGSEQITSGDLPFEFLMNSLRLKQGVDAATFTTGTGLPLSALEPTLSNLRQQGLIHPDRLQCTDQGYLYLNEVLQKFM